MNGSSYITGQYALVDYNYRFIWLTVPDYAAAVIVKDTMSSHITLVIVDLTVFPNYTDKLIDQSVCLEWEIDAPGHLFKYYLDAEQKFGDVSQHVKIDISKVKLINRSNGSMLTKNRIEELQKCLILLYKIYMHTAELYATLHMHDDSASINKKDLENICKIFKTEIYYDNVVDKLYQYANTINYNVPLLTFILRTIGKSHE